MFGPITEREPKDSSVEPGIKPRQGLDDGPVRLFKPMNGSLDGVRYLGFSGVREEGFAIDREFRFLPAAGYDLEELLRMVAHGQLREVDPRRAIVARPPRRAKAAGA